ALGVVRPFLELHPDQPRLHREPLLHAPVLPHDPARLRRSGEARRRRVLQDVLAHHAAARATCDGRARHPPVPGHMERLLLAPDPLRTGQPQPLHAPARAGGAALQLRDAVARDLGRRRHRHSPHPRHLSRFPAILRVRRRLGGSEGMSARRALGLALADLYRNSWRLVPVNAALGAVLVFSAVLAIAVHALLVLAVLAGPLAAALAHCSVTLVRTGNLVLADAWEGLLLHWRRGLALGAAGVCLGVLAALAVHFYTRSSAGWPFAFLTLYLVVLLGIYAAVLTT